MYGICSDGTKLKPLLITKTKYPIENLYPSKMMIKSNTRGWLTEDIMLEWIKKCLLEKKVSKDT